uniref:Uncharacterized protein n=1 Tax=Juglanconis sp. TaxID=2041886 RepID=A0A2P1NR29_9PEZI|nr:hypothetical protein [Juglanconis sp.]
MDEHPLHVMTINKKQDSSIIEEIPYETDRAVVGFTAQMYYSPITTFASILELDTTNTSSQPAPRSTTNNGIVPQSIKLSRSGAVDMVLAEDHAKACDLDRPDIRDNIRGQMIERDYITGRMLETLANSDRTTDLAYETGIDGWKWQRRLMDFAL